MTQPGIMSTPEHKLPLISLASVFPNDPLSSQTLRRILSKHQPLKLSAWCAQCLMLIQPPSSVESRMQERTDGV
jgi:hypothetical protein